MARILIGVTGGISAYKTLDIIRQLSKNGQDVRVILTENAQKFVTPLTVRTLAQNAVYIDGAEWNHSNLTHIELSKWADLVLIAPLTANTLAKIAHGFADNLLTSLILALHTNIPLLIAPAMNTQMWKQSVTQDNLLRTRTFYPSMTCIDPREAELACGDVGVGAMAETEKILSQIENLIS